MAENIRIQNRITQNRTYVDAHRISKLMIIQENDDAKKAQARRVYGQIESHKTEMHGC